MKPKTLVMRGIGINSHEELGKMFEWAGSDVDEFLLNQLLENPSILDQYQGMGDPGGFMMGDHPSAGQSTANRVRYSELNVKLKEKLDDPNFPIYCVCNWMQTLAKLDLFPIPVGTVANDSGKHETEYWDVKVNPGCESVWLEPLKKYDGPIFAPISHGEGRVYVSQEDLAIAREKGIIALTYTKGYICDFFKSCRGDRYNPNGSVADIAGFSWNNNLVLFPHFERLHHDYQRPDKAEVKREKGTTSGLYQPTRLMFKAAVDLMRAQMEAKR